MRVEALSAARMNLPALMDRAAADQAPIAIMRRRGEGVVLVAESDWAVIAERLSAPSEPSAEREPRHIPTVMPGSSRHPAVRAPNIGRDRGTVDAGTSPA